MPQIINWKNGIPAFLNALAHAFRPPCNGCLRFESARKTHSENSGLTRFRHSTFPTYRMGRAERYESLPLCIAKIPCALKIVRFPATMAASSRSSLHPRTPRICPGEPERYTCVYIKVGGTPSTRRCHRSD